MWVDYEPPSALIYTKTHHLVVVMYKHSLVYLGQEKRAARQRKEVIVM